MSQFYTYVCGLCFELKNNKLAIIINNKKHWVDVPKNAQKKLSELVEGHFDEIEKEKNMTMQQLCEKHVEYGSS